MEKQDDRKKGINSRSEIEIKIQREKDIQRHMETEREKEIRMFRDKIP